MELVFIHGWGFDRNIWHRMIDMLEGHRCHLVELGFTGKPPELAVLSNAVVVGHSLGVMWALKNAPSTMRGLVSIAGFDCFAAHIPAKEIRAMQRNLRTDAEKQMRGFYAACGYMPFLDVHSMDLLKLDDGLRWLGEWDERMVLKNLSCAVMALGSEDDLIVPPSMTRGIWGGYDLRMRDKGGHILPVTEAQWCAAQVGEFVNAL